MFFISVLSAGVEEDCIDKILYRSGDRVTLMPQSYAVEIELFEDDHGGQLSDHEAVSVLFAWEEI